MRLDLSRHDRLAFQPAPPRFPQRARRLGRLVAGGLLAAGVAAGLAAARLGVGEVDRPVTPVQREVARLLVEGQAADPPQTLQVDVKFRNWKALKERRQAWLQAGARVVPQDDTASASVRIGGRTVEVSLSLAGTALDTGPGELGRVRVAVRGEGTLLGMSKFVLDDPKRPGFSEEALFYAALRRAGLLAPRIVPVRIEVNGRAWGEAVAVEQPGLEGVLAAGRPDGVLVGWDPPLQPGSNADAVAWMDPLSLEPQVEGGTRRLSGTGLDSQVPLAVSQLRALAAGKLPAETLVDTRKVARFVAICDLWGQSRALQWNAARWWMHPLTLKLEPFARLSPNDAGRSGDRTLLVARLMAAPAFAAAYQKALEEEAARTATPARLHELRAALGGTVPAIPAMALVEAVEPAMQRARQVLDAGQAKLVEVARLPPAESPLAQVTPPEVALPFARIDAGQRLVEVPAGQWRLQASAFLPDGWTLRLRAGATLRLPAGAWLVVRGPLLLDGEAGAPVVLAALDDAAPEPWGGLLVMGDKARMRHVVIRDAAGVGLKAWSPQAAVALADVQLDAKHVTLQRMGGTVAALRAVGGEVRLAHVQFQACAGSAVQVTQAALDLEEAELAQIGGDAVDLVGGQGRLEGLKVRQVAGAAVRAGQGAVAHVRRLEATDVGTGLVARDGGRVDVAGGKLQGVKHLGLLAYDQAPRPEPARIDARKVTVQGARQAHLCTGGAAVRVDGQARDCSAVSVQQLVAAGIARP